MHASFSSHSLIVSFQTFMHACLHACMPACLHAFSISYLYSSFISSCLFISFRCISCPSSLPSFIQPSLISHMHIHKTKKQHHMRRTCKHSLYVCTYTQTYLPTNLHAGLAGMHACSCMHTAARLTYNIGTVITRIGFCC